MNYSLQLFLNCLAPAISWGGLIYLFWLNHNYLGDQWSVNLFGGLALLLALGGIIKKLGAADK